MTIFLAPFHRRGISDFCSRVFAAGFGSVEIVPINVGRRETAGVESRTVQFDAEENSGVTSCFCSESRAKLSSNEASEKGEEELRGTEIGTSLILEPDVIAGSCREEKEA